MKTLEIMFTRGDHATQPGGVILRQKDDGEYVTHRFNRLPNTTEPREFYWGHYISDFDRAYADYRMRVGDVSEPTITEAEILNHMETTNA